MHAVLDIVSPGKCWSSFDQVCQASKRTMDEDYCFPRGMLCVMLKSSIAEGAVVSVIMACNLCVNAECRNMYQCSGIMPTCLCQLSANYSYFLPSIRGT